MTGGRGDPYLRREGAVKTYRQARARARALKPRNWRHYLELAREHGLPTQPQTLWPEQWERGGRYAGFLGHGEDHDRIEGLGIGHATWKLIAVDVKPTATVRHKSYYDPGTLLPVLSLRLDLIRRSDARAALAQAIEAWMQEL